MTLELCEKCRHTGWIPVNYQQDRRCECFAPACMRAFGTIELTAGEKWFPPEYAKLPRWPLESARWSNMRITPTQFRHMAWRSIVPHWEKPLRYEVVSPARLISIEFRRDVGETTLEDLVYYDLIVLLVIPAAPNKILGPVANSILWERSLIGKPTWVYQGVHGGALGHMYGEDINDGLDLLGPLRKTLVP
jgi:hypothetical protein